MRLGRALSSLGFVTGFSVIGFSSSVSLRRIKTPCLHGRISFWLVCYGGCTWGTFGCAGFLSPGLLTRVQLPPSIV
ncbi:hypothetical protein CXQ81_06705 [Pseudomonas sp. 09C 129]|nr:hypothetical protein CXQ81_06705 [Pseudomonas sp. 09C 129]